MRYPMLYTKADAGEARPITDAPEFQFTLGGEYAGQGVELDASPLYVRQSAEMPLTQVISITLIKPENCVETCSACTMLNADGSERMDTGASALIVFTDEGGRTEALCYDCSIGKLAWV